jgi:hypothetical protein
MKDSTSKFEWMSWISIMVRRLRKGDVHGAANVIACCQPSGGGRFSSVEQPWFERMVRHKELEGRHWELWAEMKPLITPSVRGNVRKTLLEQGWKIRPEDKPAALRAA